MEKVILSIESLNVEKDNNKLLKNISFNFIEGKRYILLGEIGSGKSILCKIIASNFDNRYKISGKILYKNEDLLKFSEDEKRKISGSEISILSLDMRLHPYTEVRKQLEDILLAHNLFRTSKKNFDILLEKIGLPKKILSEYPFKIKEQDIQKIMILITLLLSPNIAIFIHSFRGFDSEIQKIEAELIKVRNKQENLESTLLELQKQKQEIESKQVMDAFRKSGKSMRELMIFLEG